MTGITGACLAWVPILDLILGILGIVFGGIGIYYTSQGRATNRSAAIAGLVLGHFRCGVPDLPPTHPAQRIRRSTAFSLDGQ